MNKDMLDNMLDENELSMASGGDDLSENTIESHSFQCENGHIFESSFPMICPICGSANISMRKV